MGTLTQMAAQQTQHARRLILRSNRRRSQQSVFSALIHPVFHLIFKGLIVTGVARFVSAVARILWLIHLVFFAALFTSLLTTERAFAEPLLLTQYENLKPELAQSVFGSPIVLYSDTSKHHAQGEVFAVLDTPIADIQQTLSQPEHWCELAILHINIKACTYQNKTEDQRLTIYLGRKYYQPPSQAHPLNYLFETLKNSDNHLYIKLTSDDGPFGTHDYLISFEAVPVDAQHSFIHFQYRYQFGFLARLTMTTYLNTIGRKKVGFSIKGKDLQGGPGYVKGVQGVVERNVMRYIYAIQSILDTTKSPVADRQQQGFTNWYTYIAKHPRQLVEYTREEYLQRKKQEIENQRALQANF